MLADELPGFEPAGAGYFLEKRIIEKKRSPGQAAAGGVSRTLIEGVWCVSMGRGCPAREDSEVDGIRESFCGSTVRGLCFRGMYGIELLCVHVSGWCVFLQRDTGLLAVQAYNIFCLTF